MCVTSSSKEVGKFSNNSKIEILADTNYLKFETELRKEVGNGFVIENQYIGISYGDFKEIAKVKILKLRMLTTVLELTPQQIAYIKEYYKVLKQHAPGYLNNLYPDSTSTD